MGGDVLQLEGLPDLVAELPPPPCGAFGARLGHGLLRGQLVEVAEGAPEGAGPGRAGGFTGRYGQLQSYEKETGDFVVQMLDDCAGVSAPPSAVRAPVPEEVQANFATDGAGGTGCDIVLGPQTQREALGEEAAACLLDRGFCVLRCLEWGASSPAALQVLRRAESEGRFGRLPPEIEEGHLGRHGRARAMWLDPSHWPEDEEQLLETVDAGLTSVAQAVQPFCEDLFGRELTDRTPALACLSLADAMEPSYQAPAATDEELSDLYAAWRRSALRLVHFLGPTEVAEVILRPLPGRREAGASAAAPEEFRIQVKPNTMLLVRSDAFAYELDARSGRDGEEELCWVQCFLMSPAQAFVIDGPLGGLEFLAADGAGPPPPDADLVSVVALGIQAAAGMSDHCKEWAAYMAGTDGQLEIPLARFDYRPYYSEEVDQPFNTMYVKHNGMQEGIDFFDNRIFEIANMEASAMDPQCRQVLEVGCSVLHQRGITKRWCNTNPLHASVSVGCDKEEWLNMPEAPVCVATNNQLAITANRFNYVFNLKGGSYVTDTACSSSLVATHLGKLALMERRWDPLEFHLALGTNLTLTHRLMIGSCMAHMLSPGGRCFTFNMTANGYNRGDGTAGMMLKTGDVQDERWAFLRGTQIGQDGRSASLSAPNGPAQEKCIWGAIREARMRPPESTVWECHGTGTSLGDPIEIGAVRKVQIREPRQEPLMISTSKANIGHLEGSAAMVAMCKCIMTVVKTKCAPTQHVHTLNPHLDHAKFDAIFCSEANPYKFRQGHCQVSSFGVGGTNGHAVFWGANPEGVDHAGLFLKLIRENPVAVIMDGKDPRNWEFDRTRLSGFCDDPADRCIVTISKDPVSAEVSIRYEMAPRERPPEFYCIVGSHNGWTDDRMVPGDVEGLFYAVVDVPESGVLDFRFWADGRPTRVLGPPEAACRSRCAEVLGPSEGLETFWRAEAAPGDALRVELLVASAAGPRGVTWLLEDG